MKFETMSQFLARGGKITKVQPGVSGKRKPTSSQQAKPDLQHVDFSKLPAELKKFANKRK